MYNVKDKSLQLKEGDEVVVIKILCDNPQLADMDLNVVLHVCKVDGDDVIVKELPFVLNSSYLARVEK